MNSLKPSIFHERRNVVEFELEAVPYETCSDDNSKVRGVLTKLDFREIERNTQFFHFKFFV